MYDLIKLRGSNELEGFNLSIKFLIKLYIDQLKTTQIILCMHVYDKIMDQPTILKK